MIYTARQLERLFAEQGKIVLPYRARLTPLAKDWVRAKKMQIGYSDPGVSPASKAAVEIAPVKVEPVAGALRVWCDGPCGQAKAALSSYAKQLKPIEVAANARHTADVVRLLKRELTGNDAALLLVQQSALATVLVNRCSALRGVVGTSLQAMDQLAPIGPNVLIIEYPRLTMMQVRNIVERFMRTPHVPDETLRRQLEEVACA